MRKFIPATICLVFVTSCQLSQPREEDRYFVSNVKPVLQQHCLRCHNGTTPGMNLSNHLTAFTPRADGLSYLVPGKPDASLLIQAIQRNGTHPRMMPRDLLSLTDDQIGMLREWIEDGAHWPKNSSGHLQHQPSKEHPPQ